MLSLLPRILALALQYHHRCQSVIILWRFGAAVILLAPVVTSWVVLMLLTERYWFDILDQRNCQ